MCISCEGIKKTYIEKIKTEYKNKLIWCKVFKVVTFSCLINNNTPYKKNYFYNFYLSKNLYLKNQLEKNIFL